MSTTDPRVQAEIQRRCAEKNALKCEERALIKMIKLLREQSTQLQVESLELRARARSSNPGGATPRGHATNATTPSAIMNASSSVFVVEQDRQQAQQQHQEQQPPELDLGVSHVSVLDRMHRGAFVTEEEVEEEDEESDQDP